MSQFQLVSCFERLSTLAVAIVICKGRKTKGPKTLLDLVTVIAIFIYKISFYLKLNALEFFFRCFKNEKKNLSITIFLIYRLRF